MKGFAVPAVLALLLASGCTAGADEARSMSIRGVQQGVYHYGAQGRHKGTVLFLPGDGGWRGFAVTIAESMSGWGYDVYGLDTKRYLEGFTGVSRLTERQVMSDLRAATDSVRRPGDPPVTIVGWSEGAGLGVLATSPNENKGVFRGIIAIGLPESGVLGWRWQDSVTWITKGIPDEPRFQTKPYLRSVAPLPLVMIQSSQDEWTPVRTSHALFEAAADPKRLFMVDSKNHKFEGNRDEFFRRLREALEWVNP